MIDETAEVFKGSRTFRLKGRNIQIRELSWLSTRSYLTRFAARLPALVEADGKIRMDLPTLVESVTQSQELSEELLTQTTPLTLQELGELSLSEYFALLDAVMELNITTVLASVKKVSGRLRELAVAPTAAPQAATRRP